VQGTHGAIAALFDVDIRVWVWTVIVLFWLATTVMSAIRRRARAGGSAAAAPPDDVPASAQRLDQRSTELSDQSTAPAQGMDVAKALLAQIQAARQAAGTLTVSAARAAAQPSRPAAVTSAGQALAATLSNVLDVQTAQPDLSGLPAPVQHHVGIQGLPAALHAPGGLAFAVLSATVVGPCQALKTAPQEPGGW